MFIRLQESLANATVSAQQQCVYEGPSEEIYGKSTQQNTILKNTFSGFQRCG